MPEGALVNGLFNFIEPNTETIGGYRHAGCCVSGGSNIDFECNRLICDALYFAGVARFFAREIVKPEYSVLLLAYILLEEI